MNRFARFYLSFGLSLALASSAFAYSYNGYHWPTGTDITMHLDLGNPSIYLQDGSGSWNNSASTALSIWNQYLGSVRFVAAAPVVAGSSDGLNSVFFSDTVYGQSFGPRVLAVTLYFTRSGNLFSEADVIFNNADRFDSYRGPLQPFGNTYTFDLQRVALHEFGHVLGLDHPDEDYQNVFAIMNSVISNLDHLADDDIQGAQSLYPYTFTSPTTVAPLPVGGWFTYQVMANNSPTSFSATGLPPGLSLDTYTGLISGNPSVSGTYSVTITATGTHGTISFVLKLSVATRPDNVTNLIYKFTQGASKLWMDPVRHRLYAISGASVAIVNTANFEFLKLVTFGGQPRGLAISADGKKLWVANAQSGSVAISAIDLETLEPLAGIILNRAPSDIVEGLDHRLYATPANDSQGIMQINAETGALEATLPNSELTSGGVLAISPDRKTLFAASTYGPAVLKSFDISQPTAVALQQRQMTGSLDQLVLSHDGQSLLYTGRTGNEFVDGHSVAWELSTADLQTIKGRFTSQTSDWGRASFSRDDSLVYAASSDRKITSFSTLSFAPSGSSFSTADETDMGGSIVAYDLADDSTGAYLFAALLPPSGFSELRVYRTDRFNSGVPNVAAKHLLNVSTRLFAQNGDDSLIGGFILKGNEDKRVILRAKGPSLGLPGYLTDPILKLYDSSGQVVASNDNWNTDRSAVRLSQLPPTIELESAIVTTLRPGPYTAIVSGAAGRTGVALVELYDLSPASDSRIANISTRGRVETGDNVMIGGFIIGGDQPTKVIVRAIGPSLSTRGVSGALADTTLDLYDRNGVQFASNDDWQSDQAQDIIDSTVPPSDPRESAIVRTLQPGNYTAIVRGKNETTGVALVEVYDLETPESPNQATPVPK